MTLRTKGEQKAYLDGFEMCADCIEKYLTDEGKRKLECLLVAVRNAVEIEETEPQESEDKGMIKECSTCHYCQWSSLNHGYVCVCDNEDSLSCEVDIDDWLDGICDKYRAESEDKE